MSDESALGARVRRTALVVVDALAYATGVVAVTTTLALVLAAASGGGLVRTKTLLFLVGFGLMGYATVRLWPTSPNDLEGDDDDASTVIGATVAEPDATRFQTAVRAVPPVRWLPLPPAEIQISPAGKLFWGSLAVLLVSYLMEVAFGVV